MRESPFDELAHTYDATFSDTAVGTALRSIVWSELAHVFRACHQVLELGCGTGEDALELARIGVDVVATDASPAMVAIAQRKAEQRGVRERIEFRCLPMEGIGEQLAGRSFDGVLSNFGAINCVEDLPVLVAAVAERLTAGAPLLWVIMGRRVPAEWIWFLARGDWRKAWRRMRRNGAEWRGLRVCYPSPAEVVDRLKPYFAIRRVMGLGVFLPPTYAAAWLERSPRALAVLTRLERLALRCPGLASWSDHYIVEGIRLPAVAHA